MKKLSVTVSGDTLEELAGNVVALGAELNSLGANSAPAGNALASGGSSSAAPKGKDGGKSGTKPAAAKEEAAEIDDDLGFEEPPAKEEEEEAPAMSRDDFVVAVRD